MSVSIDLSGKVAATFSRKGEDYSSPPAASPCSLGGITSGSEDLSINKISAHPGSNLRSSNVSLTSPTFAAGPSVAVTEEELRRIKFDSLVAQAEDIETSSLATRTNNCMYVAGQDNQGRPVLVFIGKWFRSADFDTDKAVICLIKLLHRVVTSGQDYVVIYFHAKTIKENVPGYGWIKEVYTTLGYDYRKRLKAFYVVHPTFWTKMTFWWLTTFMAPTIKMKIHNIHGLKELTSDGASPGHGSGIIDDEAKLSIPMFITEHDMSINGLRFYKP